MEFGYLTKDGEPKWPAWSKALIEQYCNSRNLAVIAREPGDYWIVKEAS